MSRELDIAWAAGLLEGEGSFLLQTGTSYLKVQVHMTDLDVLESLQRIFGGTIHSVAKRKEHWKDAWAWNLSGDVAKRCMEEVYPYMHGRRSLKIKECLSARKAFESARDTKRQKISSKGLKIAQEYQAGGATMRKLAKKYGISRQTVLRYVHLNEDNLS